MCCEYRDEDAALPLRNTTLPKLAKKPWKRGEMGLRARTEQPRASSAAQENGGELFLKSDSSSGQDLPHPYASQNFSLRSRSDVIQRPSPIHPTFSMSFFLNVWCYWHRGHFLREKGKTQTAKSNKQSHKGMKMKYSEREEWVSVDFAFGVVEVSSQRR